MDEMAIDRLDGLYLFIIEKISKLCLLYVSLKDVKICL